VKTQVTINDAPFVKQGAASGELTGVKIELRAKA
jgi:hypothetical protein